MYSKKCKQNDDSNNAICDMYVCADDGKKMRGVVNEWLCSFFLQMQKKRISYTMASLGGNF